MGSGGRWPPLSSHTTGHADPHSTDPLVEVTERAEAALADSFVEVLEGNRRGGLADALLPPGRVPPQLRGRLFDLSWDLLPGASDRKVKRTPSPRPRPARYRAFSAVSASQRRMSR